MSKATQFLKEIITEGLKEIVKDLFSDDDKAVQAEVSDEKSKIEEDLAKLKEKVSKPGGVEKIVEVASPVIPISNRIIKLTDNFYYIKSVNTTTFCNKFDFKEDLYPLATNSPFSSFEKGKMKGIRGVSLSMPIDRRRIVYPIVTKSGVTFGYKQVDVGPGYTKDYWYQNGTAPKTESGFDYLGNKSAKAGLDVLPQVWEDLGVIDFDTAYNTQFSMVLDMLVFEPTVITNSISKVDGHESPSNDSRTWIADLPQSGSIYFPFKELLRGWNTNDRPSTKQINNLIILSREILHPTRLAMGRIKLGSGLRDSSTNKKVGGREGSLHLDGRAADLVPLDVSFSELWTWLNNNMSKKVRELVWENRGESGEHIHISGVILPGENPNIRIKM